MRFWRCGYGIRLLMHPIPRLAASPPTNPEGRLRAHLSPNRTSGSLGWRTLTVRAPRGIQSLLVSDGRPVRLRDPATGSSRSPPGREAYPSGESGIGGHTRRVVPVWVFPYVH